MSDLSRDARAILDAARYLDDPRPSDRARVRRALLARVVAGGAAAVLTTSSATAAAAPVLKVLLATALVVTAGVGGTVWWRAQQTPTLAADLRKDVRKDVSTGNKESGPTPQAPVIERLAPEVVATEAPAATVPPRAGRTFPARSRPLVLPPRHLTVEIAILADANEALREGDPRRSLTLLDGYDRRFPEGVLRQEMTATRIIARCQLIPSPRNREAARLFLAQYPASPLASRVRSSCAKFDR